MIFCIQLTIDLFLRLRSNYRLGIHPYVFCHISRNNISMGRIMYSILPSKVKISVFFPMGLPTNSLIHENLGHFNDSHFYGQPLQMKAFKIFFVVLKVIYQQNDTLSVFYWNSKLKHKRIQAMKTGKNK